MEAKLYYTPPEDRIFEEVREAAIKVWESRGYHPDYVAEKIARIKDIANVSDNMMYIVAGFDFENQNILGALISNEARKAIYDRLIDGGAEPIYIPYGLKFGME